MDRSNELEFPLYIQQKWEEACEVVFDLLNFHRYAWREMTDSKKKIIIDMAYDNVTGAGTGRNGKVDSGLMSEEAVIADGNNEKITEDHFISSRWAIRTVLDDNLNVLDDFEEFKDLFRRLQTVVHVTPAQNRDVRYHNYNGEFRIDELTKDKYIGINWWSTKTDGWVNGFPLAEEIPEWFTDSEEKYLSHKYLIRG